jgi:hypothetical protein
MIKDRGGEELDVDNGGRKSQGDFKGKTLFVNKSYDEESDDFYNTNDEDLEEKRRGLLLLMRKHSTSLWQLTYQMAQYFILLFLFVTHLGVIQ